MKITYAGKKQKLEDAINYIDDLFDDQDFWQAISDKESFDHSSHSPSQIATYMRDKVESVEVKLYRPSWPRHRKTNAYTDKRYPNTLFYNSKKLWRSVGSIVNTIVHEYVHSVDFTEDGNTHTDYGHGSQSSAGKSDTAPYWIGNLAQQFFDTDYQEGLVIESTSIDPENILDE